MLKYTTRPVRNALIAPNRMQWMVSVQRGSTPFTVIYTENKLKLRYYEPDQCWWETPVVLTHPLINEPSILDFRPDRSVVQQCLSRGFEVYLIDWGDYTALDAALTLDDFVGRYLANCVDVACERAAAESVHLHG